MKIALVILPNWSRAMPSLGMAYLAGALVSAGHEVLKFEFHLEMKNSEWVEYIGDINKIRVGPRDSYSRNIDAILNDKSFIEKNNLSKLNDYVNHCVNEILNSGAKVVGFSVFHVNRNLTVLISNKLKEVSSDIKIVFGGPAVFICESYFKNFLTKGVADFLVFGEGEKALVELVKKIQSHELPDIPGVAYLEDGEVRCVPREHEDIDSLNLPLFTKEDIKKSAEQSALPIIASRGCVHNCNFCEEKNYWQVFRQRKPQNVVDEMKIHSQKFGVNYFRFNDSLLNANIDFIKDFCRILIKENLDVTWGGNVRCDPRLDSSILELMYSAGCRTFLIGAETGSDKVLKDMNKGINADMLERNIKDVHDNHINIIFYIIVGYPTETEDDFKKTLDLVIRNKKYVSVFSVAKFVLGSVTEKSDLYGRFEKSIIEDSDKDKLVERITEVLKDEYDISYTWSGLLAKKI